eukprot:5845013-Amphidinium_carterae.2
MEDTVDFDAFNRSVDDQIRTFEDDINVLKTRVEELKRSKKRQRVARAMHGCSAEEECEPYHSVSPQCELRLRRELKKPSIIVFGSWLTHAGLCLHIWSIGDAQSTHDVSARHVWLKCE